MRLDRLRHRLMTALFLCGLLLLFAAAGNAQLNSSQTSDVSALLDQGRKELQAARMANAEEAYRAAVTTLNRAVLLDPRSGLALAYRGLAKLELSGWLARPGKFQQSGPLLTESCADLDAAVALNPADDQLRMLRGASYAEFPAFLNKGATARQDLETVVHSPCFVSQSGARRAYVLLRLGRLYAAQGDAAKAMDAWEKVLDADREGADGRAAQEELRRLSAPPQASDSQGRPKPDRFPRISADTSPVIVSASVTLPGHSFAADPSTWHPKMREFMEQLQHQPGLLAVHRLTSLDHPGMLVILTWWENKKALNDWFYSDTHQGMIRWAYEQRDSSCAAAASQSPNQQMTGAAQSAMELFTTLPGSIQYGGGIGPKPPDPHH